MPIQVTCSCGKKFSANDQWAGRTAKCPSCGQPIQIPHPQQQGGGDGLSDLLSEAGMETRTGKSCPGCGASAPEEAVLCIECGYNFQTGRQMETLDGSGLKVGASETEKALARAAMEIDSSPIQQEGGYGTMLGAWVMVLIMSVGLGVGVLILYAGFKWVDNAPDPNARAAWVMFFFGLIMSWIGNIWLWVVAFRESVVQGLLVMFVPCYNLIFVFTHFSECMVPFVLGIVGGTMTGVARVMLEF